ncbi:MAG: CPBP family intramembrane glutamic endopeptidase [Bacteroidales bacterium]
MKKFLKTEQVLLYYVIAVGLSMFFRVPQLNPEWYINLQNYNYGWILISLLRASGPLVGGILCINLFRNRYNRLITLTGRTLAGSAIYFGAPVLLIAILGINSSGASNSHLFGLLSGLTILLYCLFEEMGWRGFLQDAMRGVPNPYRFIVIGTLWYLWHLNFLSPELHSLKFGLLFHLPSCIFGSWIIGFLADKYKSIMVAAAIHSIFNIFFDLQTDIKSKLFIVAGVLLIWMTSSYILDKLSEPMKEAITEGDNQKKHI